MTPFLYYDTLEDQPFQDIALPIGVKGIQARIVQPPGDRRIPGSKATTILLVACQVDEPSTPSDPKLPSSGWHLRFPVTDAKGAASQATVALLARPLGGDFVERIPPPATPPDVTGMLYVGTFWVDIGGLYRNKTFRPGMKVELHYRQQASTSLTLT